MELHEVSTEVLYTLCQLNAGEGDSVSNCELKCSGVDCGECPVDPAHGRLSLGDLRAEKLRRESPIPVAVVEPEYTGGSSSYYTLEVKNTTSGIAAYTAECNDIIEALGMNFAEGNAFKALWRRAAQRTLGKVKKGADADGLYDAEKVEFFGKRLVEQSKAVRSAE